jgi:hypothetical protein
MDEQLLGYLIDALEPDERREVESYLQLNPEANEQLENLRLALEPLASDAEPIDPPDGLWLRTLARVGEHNKRPALPAAPITAGSRALAAPRTWWRRADVLVAASILLCVGLLVPPGITKLRFQAAITACQENLRSLYVALAAYSDHHNGEFPDVAHAAPPPRNTASVFIPVLRESQLLSENVSIRCPTADGQTSSTATLHDVRHMSPQEFERYVQSMAGCYAYSLGYTDENGVHALRLVADHASFMPILADCPPNDVAMGNPGNSAAHEGLGQNVLFIDGHCRFTTVRTVGLKRDDIYLNLDGKVGAGKTDWDAVLGSPDSRP